MKKIMLTILFAFAINIYAVESNSQIEDPCLDAAIESYNLAVEKYGEFSDEDGVNYLNVVYAMCDNFLLFN